ncbi:hypothetical protein SLA2020_009770 [Shorea laevis]
MDATSGAHTIWNMTLNIGEMNNLDLARLMSKPDLLENSEGQSITTSTWECNASQNSIKSSAKNRWESANTPLEIQNGFHNHC